MKSSLRRAQFKPILTMRLPRRCFQPLQKENYDRDLSNTELSEVFGYHPYHLNRIFKARFGTTVHQALINERMDISHRLLADTDLSVNEISDIVGYKDRIAFYYAFKKNTGMSPVEFRAEKQV